MKGFYYNRNKVIFNGEEIPLWDHNVCLHYGEIISPITHLYDNVSDFVDESKGHLGIWRYKTFFRKKIIYRISIDGIYNYSKRLKPSKFDEIEWVEYKEEIKNVSVREMQNLSADEFAEWCRDNRLGIMEINKTQVL